MTCTDSSAHIFIKNLTCKTMEDGFGRSLLTSSEPEYYGEKTLAGLRSKTHTTTDSLRSANSKNRCMPLGEPTCDQGQSACMKRSSWTCPQPKWESALNAKRVINATIAEHAQWKRHEGNYLSPKKEYIMAHIQTGKKRPKNNLKLWLLKSKIKIWMK